MVRILGNNLSNKKKIYIALTAIYGVGINTSKKILSRLNIDPDIKVTELTDKNIADLREILETDEYISINGNKYLKWDRFEFIIYPQKKIFISN